MTQPRIVGIDLGTTNSLAAFVSDGRPTAVRDEAGVALVPSCISFHDDGSVLVGSAARARALSDPDHTIFSVKRLMGRSLAELRDELPLIPHQIVERETADGRKVLNVRIADREHTPEELSAMILREVRRRAGDPTRAVITVPAYFDDAQRQATRDAGRIAGLDVLRIVNEPTAAALAYGLDRRSAGTVAVYDLGGGTFDCSILRITDGVFQVLATHGDTHLGGDDFDRALMTAAAQRFALDLTARNPELLQRLRDAAESTKIRLTDHPTAEFPFGDQSTTFTRAEFEALIDPFVTRTLDSCRAAMRDADLTPEQIDEVVLVGGSSRVPFVRRRVEEFFGRPPHCELNPEEVVALGAAVQADILAGHRDETLLLDVIPLSLGIETLGGVVDKLIHRNFPVPARATVRYTTAVDNQTAVILNVYQGERELAKDCRLLGQFKLADIPPMPAQLPQIDVTFLVDADGLLTVSAEERRSGRQMSVSVKPPHGLSKDEVEELVFDSIVHAHSDFLTRRLIELRQKVEDELRHTEKGLQKAGDQLTDAQRADIDQAIAEVRDALPGEDTERIYSASARLARVTQPLAELLMNAILAATLKGRLPSEVTPDLLK